MSPRIPTFDIARFIRPSSGRDRAAFVAGLGAAYRQWGFAGIRNHGIPQELIDAAYAVFQRFFALPDEVKRRYHLPGAGGARGYTPLAVETARDSVHPDLKEFWHIGREIADDSPHRAVMPPNLWPAEVPGFREHGYALYLALDALGSQVLSALAIHIGLPEDWFAARTGSGNSILRPIHYPPVDAGPGPRGRAGVRAAAHEDINLITLLVGASASGLEVLSRGGQWVPFTAEADTIVVNIGDMLQRLTNHVYPSTTHRVVNPPGPEGQQSRYSVPFFLHPDPDFSIDVLPCCVTADNPCRYPQPITANAYLEQRLREIRLK